eukprot:COSAG06_NODE_9684_length_1845_cov_1.203322_2_plen_67_part_00
MLLFLVWALAVVIVLLLLGESHACRCSKRPTHTQHMRCFRACVRCRQLTLRSRGRSVAVDVRAALR